MKKYLMMGVSALVFGVMFTSCSHDDGISAEEYYKAVYEKAFEQAFGKVSPNQDWGFGVQGSTRATRSQADPAVPNINAPYDEAWVTTYLTTATEPNSENVTNNDANASVGITKNPVMPAFSQGSYANNCQYNPNQVSEADKAFYTNTFKPLIDAYWAAPQENSSYNNEENYVTVNNAKIDKFLDLYNAVVAYAGEGGVSNWLNITTFPEKGAYGAGDFVLNFKITGTYSGGIAVAATEGLTNGVENGNQRTIVVTGTWNITENQKIGSLGKIIIANGGTVNVASGKTLEMVNQARLVVLRGGKLTGAGSVTVNNGNAVGEENYNAGTVDVATFNNNFGKFYNYGSFLVNEYQGGAKESNFYNHALVAIDHTSSTANARIFNGCQFYVKNDARLRNYEGVGGSALIVGGQLLFSGSEDGTTTPTYVGLAAGALVKCGSLYNNGTSWSGPTSGYAALEIVNQIDYLNWQQDAPETGGYFENNIYVKAGTWNNIPTGNGYQAGETATADYKFFSIVANCRGNNGVTKVEDGSYEVISADGDFKLGEDGCTPGFKIKKDDPNESTKKSIRIMAEDLSATEASDYDFNDVVFDVEADFSSSDAVSQVTITLWAAGGTLPLRLNGDGNLEVHDLLGTATNCMTNTHAQAYADGKNWFAEDDADNSKSWTGTITLAKGATISKDNFNSDVNKNLLVEVQKDGVWIALYANQGEPACKIGCPVGTPWALEKNNMNTAFSSFKSWVNNNTPTNWYGSSNSANTYNEGMSVICSKCHQ